MVQPGKNHWNAAFWCGAPAMLRRSALEQVGGVSTASATEDIATSVELHRHGWKSVYHHGLVAAGIAPEDYRRFYQQRLRWVRGGIHVFRQQLIRRSSGMEGMKLTQRLSYLASTGRPWDVMRQMVFYAFTPLVMFTGIFPIHGNRVNIIAFGVAQVAIFLGTVAFSRGTYRIIYAEIYDIVSMGAGIVALSSFWESRPRSFAVTKKGRPGLGRRSARSPLWWIVFLAAIYLAAVPVGLLRARSEGLPGATFFLVFSGWTFAFAVLLGVCVLFALTHGNQAWRGLSIAPAPATVATADGGALAGAITRIAVDQLEVVVPGSNSPGLGDVVHVETVLFRDSLPGTVNASTKTVDAATLQLELLDPSLELAEFVARAMFELEYGEESAPSVVRYGTARAESG